MRFRAGVRRAQGSRYGQSAAVVGLGSRAIIYGGLAALVAQLALGVRRGSTDQGSALASLGTFAGGPVLLVAVLIGVVCYVAWRWSEALLGPVGSGDGWRPRVMAVIEGFGYLPFAYLSVSVLSGNPRQADQGRQYRSLSGDVLRTTTGRVGVGIIGAVVVGVGVFFCVQGFTRSFTQHLDLPRSRWVRVTVLILGTVGSFVRGLVFAIAGGLVVYAAVDIDPQAAGGLDAALDALRRQPLGTALLVLAAIGFGAFAVFALAEATWRER